MSIPVSGPHPKEGVPLGWHRQQGAVPVSGSRQSMLQTNISHLSSTLAGVYASHLQNTTMILSEPGRICA